jgi:hypothetical protein
MISLQMVVAAEEPHPIAFGVLGDRIVDGTVPITVIRALGLEAPVPGTRIAVDRIERSWNPYSDSRLYFCTRTSPSLQSPAQTTCLQIDDSRNVPFLGGYDLGLPDERFGVICYQPRDIHAIFRFFDAIDMDWTRCREEVVDGLGLEIPRWVSKPKDDGCAGGSGAGLLWPLASLVAMWRMRRRVAAALPRGDRDGDREGATPVKVPTAIGAPAMTASTSSGASGGGSSARDPHDVQMQPPGRMTSDAVAEDMRVDPRGLRRRLFVTAMMALILGMSAERGARAEAVIGGPPLDVRDCFCAILRPSYAYVTFGMLETTLSEDTGTHQHEIIAFRSLGPDAPRDGTRVLVNADQLSDPADSNLYMCRRTPVGLTTEPGMTCVGLDGTRSIRYLGTPVVGSGDKTLWDVCPEPREIHQIMDFFDEIDGEHDVCRAEVADALDLELPPSLRAPADGACTSGSSTNLIWTIPFLWMTWRRRHARPDRRRHSGGRLQ